MTTGNDRRSQRITIYGLVIPVAWNNEGRPTRVSIATYDEDEYIIEDDDVALELLDFLGEEAVISGVLQETSHKKSLTQCSISKVKAFSSQ